MGNLLKEDGGEERIQSPEEMHVRVFTSLVINAAGQWSPGGRMPALCGHTWARPQPRCRADRTTKASWPAELNVNG